MLLEFTGERIIPDMQECGEHTRIYKEHTARYHFATQFLTKFDSVLDIACGVGYGSGILAQTAREVYGCDIDKQALEYANKRYPHATYIQMNATDIRFGDETFNAIVSFETIEHIPDYRQVMKEFYRVLKKGGVLIMSSPNKNTSRGDSEFHYKEFTKDELVLELSDRFVELEFYSQLLPNHEALWMRLMRSAIKKGMPIKPIYQKLAELVDYKQSIPVPYRGDIDSKTQNLIVVAYKKA